MLRRKTLIFVALLFLLAFAGKSMGWSFSQIFQSSIQTELIADLETEQENRLNESSPLEEVFESGHTLQFFIQLPAEKSVLHGYAGDLPVVFIDKNTPPPNF
jgi:hypothetical protein